MFKNIVNVIEEFKKGKFVIVTDDEDREDEGDLIIGAQFVTNETISFMLNHAKGLICVPMDRSIIEDIGIPMMVDNPDNTCANFTVSVDSIDCSTGISATDRALTVQALLDPNSDIDDFVMPGHMFPLRAVDQGICSRRGHTEAAVDLCRLADIRPAGVLAEILNDQGEPATDQELKTLATKFDIPIITIENLKRYKDYINNSGRSSIETT